MARHIAAIGGQANLNAIQSLQVVSILDDHGTLHPMFGDRRRPNLLRVRMMHGGELVFTEAYDGAGSWEGAPGKENCTPDSAATAATRHAAEQFDDPLITAARRDSLRFAGITVVGGRRAYALEMRDRAGTITTFFVDSATYMLSRVRNRRPLHPTEPVKTIDLVLEDYRPVAKVLMPFRSMERDADTGEPLTTSLALWIEANVPVSGDVFAKPPSCR